MVLSQVRAPAEASEASGRLTTQEYHRALNPVPWREKGNQEGILCLEVATVSDKKEVRAKAHTLPGGSRGRAHTGARKPGQEEALKGSSMNLV